jgi:hypothetical protein
MNGKERMFDWNVHQKNTLQAGDQYVCASVDIDDCQKNPES